MSKLRIDKLTPGTITLPGGRRRVTVLWNFQTMETSGRVAELYPGVFYVDDDLGVMLTDDLDDLAQAQEIGFVFPEWVLA